MEGCFECDCGRWYVYAVVVMKGLVWCGDFLG